MDIFSFLFPKPEPSNTTRDKTTHQPFTLPDFSRSKVISEDNLYREDFRYQTINALAGTLKHYADRQDVAEVLWGCRGSGLNAGEVRSALNDLAKEKNWPDDRTKAVFNKLGLYW